MKLKIGGKEYLLDFQHPRKLRTAVVKYNRTTLTKITEDRKTVCSIFEEVPGVKREQLTPFIVAEAACSEMDIFTKARGRELALSRLLLTQKGSGRFNEDGDKREVMVDIFTKEDREKAWEQYRVYSPR